MSQQCKGDLGQRFPVLQAFTNRYHAPSRYPRGFILWLQLDDTQVKIDCLRILKTSVQELRHFKKGRRDVDAVREHMLEYIDGVECWHSRNDAATTSHYIEFCRKHDLLMTGGSDCHQKPILLGTVDMPDFVAKQFVR